MTPLQGIMLDCPRCGHATIPAEDEACTECNHPGPEIRLDQKEALLADGASWASNEYKEEWTEKARHPQERPRSTIEEAAHLDASLKDRIRRRLDLPMVPVLDCLDTDLVRKDRFTGDEMIVLTDRRVLLNEGPARTRIDLQMVSSVRSQYVFDVTPVVAGLLLGSLIGAVAAFALASFYGQLALGLVTAITCAGLGALGGVPLGRRNEIVITAAETHARMAFRGVPEDRLHAFADRVLEQKDLL